MRSVTYLRIIGVARRFSWITWGFGHWLSINCYWIGPDPGRFNQTPGLQWSLRYLPNQGPHTSRIESLIDANLRLPAAFTSAHQVVAEEIDEYAHVNNAIYLQWLDGIAWAHSSKLGLPIERCLALRRGMAVRHTRVDYLEAALLGDALLIATWIVACDSRLRCTRRFEILRVIDGRRVLEAEIDYFCLNLDTGKPCRFPREFVDCYAVMPEVAAAIAGLPNALRGIGHA